MKEYTTSVKIPIEIEEKVFNIRYFSPRSSEILDFKTENDKFVLQLFRHYNEGKWEAKIEDPFPVSAQASNLVLIELGETKTLLGSVQEFEVTTNMPFDEIGVKFLGAILFDSPDYKRRRVGCWKNTSRTEHSAAKTDQYTL